jgi:hypothetical protein
VAGGLNSRWPSGSKMHRNGQGSEAWNQKSEHTRLEKQPSVRESQQVDESGQKQ